MTMLAQPGAGMSMLWPGTMAPLQIRSSCRIGLWPLTVSPQPEQPLARRQRGLQMALATSVSVLGPHRWCKVLHSHGTPVRLVLDRQVEATPVVRVAPRSVDQYRMAIQLMLYTSSKPVRSPIQAYVSSIAERLKQTHKRRQVAPLADHSPLQPP